MHQHSGPATVQLVPDERSDEEGEAAPPLPGFVPQLVYKAPLGRPAHRDRTGQRRRAAPPRAWRRAASGLPAQQPTPPRPTLPPSHPSAPHHNRLFLGVRRRPASALPRPSQRPSYHPVRWRPPPSSSVSARKGKPQSSLTPCVEAPAAHRVGSPGQLRGWPQSPGRAVSDGVSVNLNEAMTISINLV